MADKKAYPEIMVEINYSIIEKIEEYQNKTGASKAWIARKLGISSQRLYTILKADNLTLDVLIRIAYILNCDIKDLYTVRIDEQLNLEDFNK